MGPPGRRGTGQAGPRPDPAVTLPLATQAAALVLRQLAGRALRADRGTAPRRPRRPNSCRWRRPGRQQSGGQEAQRDQPSPAPPEGAARLQFSPTNWHQAQGGGRSRPPPSGHCWNGTCPGTSRGVFWGEGGYRDRTLFLVEQVDSQHTHTLQAGEDA